MFIIYWITKELFKSEKIALSAALILTLSTWGLKISRVMLDSGTALFFFLFGIWLFIKAKKIRDFIVAWIVLFLGTLSYYGSLFVLPLLVLILIIYRWNYIKKYKKPFFLGSGIVLFIFGLILLFMLFHPGENSRSLGRSSEIIFFQEKNITDNVIYDRSTSVGPEIVDKIFINKLTYLWRSFFFNYLEAFSPRMIFVEGDPNVNYGLWGRGELAILDFPLLILGLFYLFKKSKKGLFFVGSIILISPLTSGLTGTVYATRAFLMWPFLIIVIGGGLAKLFEWSGFVKGLNWKAVLFLIFFSFYIFFFFSKLYQYFYRYPTYASEAWFDSEKQLAGYLIEHSGEKIDIYSLEGRQMFMEYFFFSKMDPKIAQAALDKKNIKAPIQAGNFKFVNGCFDWEKYQPKNKTIINTHCIPLDLTFASETITSRDGSNQIKWAIFLPQSE